MHNFCWSSFDCLLPDVVARQEGKQHAPLMPLQEYCWMYAHTQGTHTLTYGTHTQLTHMWSVCLVSAYCRHLPFRLSVLLLLPLFPSLVLFRLSTGSTDPWQATSTVCPPVSLSADQHKPWRHSLRSLTLMLFVPLSLSFSLTPSLALAVSLSSLAKRFTALRQLGQNTFWPRYCAHNYVQMPITKFLMRTSKN